MDDKEKVFMEEFAVILDKEKFTMETELNDLENWDSLANADFLGLADESYGKALDPMSVRMAVTVRDLYELLTAAE